MKWFSAPKDNFSQVLKKYFSAKNETTSLEPLYELLEAIKKENFDVVLAFLKNSPEITENLSYYIHQIFKGRPFNLSLTEANILSENAFVPELKKRLLDKVLPEVGIEKSVWYLVDHVCIQPAQDLKYLSEIPKEESDELFRLLKIDRIITNKFVRNQILFSANILAYRVIGNALDPEVIHMAPEYRNFDNPFLALQKEMEYLTSELRSTPNFQISSKNEHYKQIRIYLRQCEDFVDLAFKNSSKYGISGKINQSLLKIRQQVKRISEIIFLLVLDVEDDVIYKSKLLVFNILEYKTRKNNVSELFDDSTRLLSHLITNHTAETGVHYISSTVREYVQMFWKASGGGVIVGALCVLKMLYSYTSGSEFSHAFLYAFNYAMGFIMIYLMGYTLATKQPAMTAATMAKVLSDEKNSKKNYLDFAHLVSKLFRTQFIAFVGNVFWAFPVSIAIIYGLDVLFNQNLAADKSTKLLHDLDPIHSKAIVHACIAGFYLFISGIISGNVGNSMVFYDIPRRIEKSSMLVLIFGRENTKSLSKFIARNWPGIISNFWFGTFLGVTAPIGAFLGLDLDIRHITFAAGNLALGLYGKDFLVDSSTFWTCLITVFLIGFFNFLVSFGLSMILAFRSRKVTMGDVGEIVSAIFKYFIKNPLRFFFPIRSFLDIRAKEMMEKTISMKSEDR